MECYYCYEKCQYQYQCKKLKDDLEEFKKRRNSQNSINVGTRARCGKYALAQGGP